jgi:hypothetical protein
LKRRALRVTPGQAVTGIRHATARHAIDLGEQVLPVDQLVIAAGHRSPLLALPGLRCRVSAQGLQPDRADRR